MTWHARLLQKWFLLWRAAVSPFQEMDRICDVCHGASGAVPGNSNVVCFGSPNLMRVLCDYCWAEKCECGHVRGVHIRAVGCHCHRFSHACADCECDGFYGAGWMS